jgi:hypothetical protein
MQIFPPYLSKIEAKKVSYKQQPPKQTDVGCNEFLEWVKHSHAQAFK